MNSAPSWTTGEDKGWWSGADWRGHSPEPTSDRRHAYSVPLASFVAAYMRSPAIVGDAETGVPIRLAVQRTSPAKVNACTPPSVPKTPHPIATVPFDTAGEAIDPTSSECRHPTMPAVPTQNASPAFLLQNTETFARAGGEATEPFRPT